jgi:hypothetical protein
VPPCDVQFIKGMQARVQGNCKSQPSPQALAIPATSFADSLIPGQCVLLTDVRLFVIEQNLWLDSLFIRSHSSVDNFQPLVAGRGKWCNVWLTSVVLQGVEESSQIQTDGLSIDEGQLYAEGVLTCSSSTQHLRLTSLRTQKRN